VNLLGCVSVTASVALDLTGFVPLWGLVRPRLPASATLAAQAPFVPMPMGSRADQQRQGSTYEGGKSATCGASSSPTPYRGALRRSPPLTTADRAFTRGGGDRWLSRRSAEDWFLHTRRSTSCPTTSSSFRLTHL
jgi:hypothetical protein